jgi:hypothetical protein
MALDSSMSMQNAPSPLSLAIRFYVKMPPRYAYAATVHDLKGPQTRHPSDETLDETWPILLYRINCFIYIRNTQHSQYMSIEVEFY